MTSLLVSEQLRALKVTIEASLSPPFRIAVVSATEADGTAQLAMGLAQVFAASGFRIALILSGAVASTESEPIVLGDCLESFFVNQDRVTAGDPIDAILLGRKSSYDIIIVDGSATASSWSLAIASRVDGTLIAVQSGRRALNADRELIPTLGRIRAKVFGVVTLDPAWIESGKDAVSRASLFHANRIAKRS